VFKILIGIAIILVSELALAHDHGQFGQYSDARDQWLRSQKHPKSGVSCCSENDADLVQEDIREGHYWIKWRHFDWTRVPDEAVLPHSNPNGQPVVWWVPVWGQDGSLTPKIYCYAPGAGI
jgi:hypothetical protein